MVGEVPILSGLVAWRHPTAETAEDHQTSKPVLLMPRYMLDTDTVSFALRGQGRAASRLLEHRPSELCISSITLAELRFGAEAKRSRKLHALIDTFADAVDVAPFDQAAADRFAAVATSLARRGQPIGTFDTLMAAQALALKVTFVTNNLKHFERVVGLKTESWV